MSTHTVHTTLTSSLFVMQVIFLVFLSIAMFFMGLPLFGALVGFATICLALTSGIAVIKHTNHMFSERNTLGDIINRILSNSTNPTSIFKRDSNGNTTLLYSNTEEEFMCIEDYLCDIDPLERVIFEDTVNSGKSATTTVLTKKDNGDLTEFDILFIPIASDDSPSRYIISSKIKVKEISANVISLSSVRQKFPE